MFKVYKSVPQKLLNIKVKDKKIINSARCKKAIKTANILIKNKGRLLVRASGTEQKVRIMCESSNISLMNKCVAMVKKQFIRMKPKSKVLIIAGSDSSGGAGIQADIKTVTSLGSYAMSAVTAVTAQNTTGVKSIVPIKPKEISKQINFSIEDIKPNAVKIGMLHSKQVIQAVIKSLKKLKLKK